MKRGYIVRDGTIRGKYSLTDKAATILDTMQNGGIQR